MPPAYVPDAGDIVWINFDPQAGHEQAGHRPAVVLSPAAYTPEMVPNGLKFIIYANPLSYYVLSFQDLVCYGRVPPLSYLTAVITLAFASFGFGAWFFKRTKYVFFDYA